ncbi:MAG: hypothetical protein JW967_06925 [Dehalococcoidales bacterium]|nr:hypothetical protein [Dehalococcoidales bacterium]
MINTKHIPVDIEAVRKVNVLTDRLQKRKREWENAQPIVCPESSIAFTKSWKKTVGLPLDLRWAKTFGERIKAAAPIIREGELIVGSLTKHIKGVDVIAAYRPNQIIKMVKDKRFESRLRDTALAGIDEEDAKLLEEDAQYWFGHMTPDYINNAIIEELGEDHLDLLADRSMVFEDYFAMADLSNGIFNQGFNGSWAGMPAPNSYVINRGLKAIITRAKVEMEKLEKEGGNLVSISSAAYHKHVLLRSIIISCEAIIDWACRHAELARNMAKTESDFIRKKELEQIARHCEWVPANPPRSFWEAVQSLRFIHLAIKKEQPDRPSVILGRLDQMLYPYYKKDLSEGKITRQEAAELLGCLWLKTREMEILETVTKEFRIAPGTLLQNITVGGRDENGRDVTNELSWLVLAVMTQMKLSEPAVYIRYHNSISDDFLLYALECNREFGGGNPAFISDKLGTDTWIARGIKAADAVDWEATGCLAFRLTSCDPPFAMHLNQAKILEITLHNGFDPRIKKQLGLRTGDIKRFHSIDQVYEAFFKQMDYFAGQMRKDLIIRLSVDRINTPVSGLSSALIEDSMVKGLAPVEGGNKYPVSNTLWIADRGITDVTDCFSAIKYLVFDKKKITMGDLLDAIDANWEGKENINQMCLAAPKYGNDDAYVDDIFKYISSKTKEILQSRPCPITGQKPFLFRGAAQGHIIHGFVVGALPNGRKAGSPVNDAGTSAMPGMDTNGPTALINSATKMDYSDFMGIAHNMKFSKELLKSTRKLEKVGALLKTFFAQGGWHIQFNIHSAQELIEAKKHPEKWRNLVVRVGGYSAYFVDLSPGLQDEIIARTLHEV